MATQSWKVTGQYYETCNCAFWCPCILQQMQPEPTEGTCLFAMGYQIENGSFGSTSLDGLGFMVVGFTPEAMGMGNLVGRSRDRRPRHRRSAGRALSPADSAN